MQRAYRIQKQVNGVTRDFSHTTVLTRIGVLVAAVIYLAAMVIGYMDWNRGRTVAAGSLEFDTENDLQVDLDPDRVLVLPTSDLTLFPHVSSAHSGELDIRWSAAGPSPVGFSAPRALITSARFAAPGEYFLHLSVSGGLVTVMRTVRVIVQSGSNQTAFYVDPTYNGSASDGTAARPWKTLASDRPNAQWSAVNRALASDNVVIYFSARQAAADTPELEHNSINIWRTDKGPNRLTLDGMSKYNANDTRPLWLDYPSLNKFQIRVKNGSISIGVQSDQTSYPANHTTIRGFDVDTRVTFAGNDTVVEYVNARDLKTSDPTILFHSAVRPDCKPAFGNLHGITIRNNRIERGKGEGIYINGNYILESDGGCPSWGNTHGDILIESNIIVDPGANGGQGDALDLKTGLTNVTIRGNRIQHSDQGARARNQGAKGIASSGVFNSSTTKSNFLVENNLLINAPAGMMFSYINDATIRNNVLFNAAESVITGGISTNFNDESSPVNFNLKVYNNTIYHGMIGFLSTSGATVRNNLISGLLNGNVQVYQHGNCSNINSDYNSLVRNAANDNWREGSHSIYLPGDATLFVDLGMYSLRLRSGVAPIGAGMALSPPFPDFDGVARPSGAAWDIGAYQFVAGR